MPICNFWSDLNNRCPFNRFDLMPFALPEVGVDLETAFQTGFKGRQEGRSDFAWVESGRSDLFGFDAWRRSHVIERSRSSGAISGAAASSPVRYMPRLSSQVGYPLQYTR